jgi:hypothetical protein
MQNVLKLIEKVPRCLREGSILAAELERFLLRQDPFLPEGAEKILSMPHAGFAAAVNFSQKNDILHRPISDIPPIPDSHPEKIYFFSIPKATSLKKGLKKYEELGLEPLHPLAFVAFVLKNPKFLEEYPIQTMFQVLYKGRVRYWHGLVSPFTKKSGWECFIKNNDLSNRLNSRFLLAGTKKT